MALESPFEVQEVVVVVTSPSPPASPSLSNIFIFPADVSVDKYLRGAGTGIIIWLYSF